MAGPFLDKMSSESLTHSNADHSMVINVSSDAEEQEQMDQGVPGSSYRLLNFYAHDNGITNGLCQFIDSAVNKGLRDIGSANPFCMPCNDCFRSTHSIFLQLVIRTSLILIPAFQWEIHPSLQSPWRLQEHLPSVKSTNVSLWFKFQIFFEWDYLPQLERCYA